MWFATAAPQGLTALRLALPEASRCSRNSQQRREIETNEEDYLGLVNSGND